MHRDIKALKAKIDALDGKVEDRLDFQGGQMGEFGAQLYGIHVVQQLLCEKLGITAEQVEAHVEAHKARMLAQNEHLRELAAKAHAAAQAEKERQAAEAAAVPAEATPALTLVDMPADEMPLEYAFTMPGPAITAQATVRSTEAAETTETPGLPAGGEGGETAIAGSDQHDHQG